MGNKTQKLSNVVDQIVEWQAVVTADGSTGLTAVAGRGYFIDTTSGAITVTLPASPKIGDTIAIKDYAGTFGTNNLTIARNGNNIQGVANDSEIVTNRASVELVFIDSTKGWLYTNESNVADLQEAVFITATGGTITTSGDFKIHSFTGDGCFVVSQLGNPVGGGSNVDYLVVAGGGGGGSDQGGGGGAGGFREGRVLPAPESYTASPLVAPAGLPVSLTTYPVTVGGGGARSILTVSGSGSNSIFSTITSTGGGGGGGYASPNSGAPQPGGSGGGSGGSDTPGKGPVSTGNTPPTSPPQGNPGGLTGPGDTGASGGGAGGAGIANGCGGGAGVTTSISGSPTGYAGGGGGRSTPAPAGIPFGAKGYGPGAPGTGPTYDGTANTGSGGGGAGIGGPAPTNEAGAGGSGIVIIRYKFQ